MKKECLVTRSRKYPLIFLLFVLYSGLGHSQVGVQANYIKPSHDFGFLFKSTLGGEISYGFHQIDAPFQTTLSVGYHAFTPRADTTYGSYTIEGNNNNGGIGTLLPGFDVWQYYRMLFIGGGVTYKVLDNWISPTVGLDAHYHLISMAYIRDTGISNIDFAGGGYLGTLSPKVGVQANLLDTYLVNAGIAKCFGLNDLGAYQSYWKIFLSASYFW